MTEKRIQFNNIVQNQLPSYIREEFPLISEFLKQYYISQEFKGAPVDLIQNIDKYIKLDETTNLTDSVVLNEDISFIDSTINVDLLQSPSGTTGFPDSYGILKIDNEIITYTGKTFSSFTGCIRGFSGISSYKDEANQESLVFDETNSEEHKKGSSVLNLNNLFLKEFLLKTKRQILPGLDDRSLSTELNQNLFIKQSKDFYLSRGTDRSFEILFKSLYNEDVRIIRPRDFLTTPSNAQYNITNDIVVESVSGDPLNLEQSTLFQDQYGDSIKKSYAPITSVEKILSNSGEVFYKLSIDSGYNRDVTFDGATYGEFSVHPKTRVIGRITPGTSTFDVDSTVGFPSSGELYVTYNDETTGVVSYSSKSLTQFYGCENVIGIIEDASDVGINTYAYGYSFSNQDEVVKVRINSVLSNLVYSEDSHYFSRNDTVKIKTLGIEDKGFKSKNWFYNNSSIFKVKSITLIDISDGTYRIDLNKDHYFRIGDSISIIGSDNVERLSTVIDVNSSSSIIIKGQGELQSDTYHVKRNILKVESNVFPSASIFSTNVQNLYKDGNNTLVASTSIPTYSSQPLDSSDHSVVFSGTFVGDTFKITSTSDHGFYTGDPVYYFPEKIEESFISDDGSIQTREVVNSFLFEEGLYFVKRIDSTTIKLSKSKTNIYNSKFITIDNEVSVSNNKIIPYEFRNLTLSSQRILREVSSPIDDGNIHETSPGFTGILINGVEIKNYKSKDTVYYGQINDIEVVSPGSDYDVINPPLLHIEDNTGIGATGYPSVSGSLSQIRILDPGFDYEETPIVSITGGNGSGAVASVKMKLIEHSPTFNSEESSSNVGLGTIGASFSTIGFSTYHKFRNAEEVIYVTSSQRGVGGISTNSNYYVSVQDEFTVKLHRSLSDAIAGINTVILTSHGIGKHSLKSVNKKSVVESINVISSGSNYQNKKRTSSPSGISTSQNIININNHGYNSGEIVKYTCEGTTIDGLNQNEEYYVIKVDDNSFRLANVGAGSTNKEFFYNTGQYVNLNTSGIGTHIFNYQDIRVTVRGKIGISSVGSETFEARIQPIFRGEITSVHLSNNGVGYGSSDIVNFNRQPLVSLVSGNDAQLLPIVNNGQITEVLVLNPGKEYNSPPNIRIIGDGSGAVVTPVLENNTIKAIKVIEGGSGYTQQNTSSTVVFPGSGAEFKSNIQTWTINLFERNFSNFTNDDGYICEANIDDFGLQYSHLYAPRKLRESLFSVDQTGKILYGKRDLRKINGVESNSTDHSPIIGWAYDGNPIYGPYGYTSISGGVVAQVKSGYRLSLKPSRPPLTEFPEGFFVEDYSYFNVNDDLVLDENNGRFCITPEFPLGTYAYFATVNDSSVDSSGPFLGYKRPSFPYLIGNGYKSSPNKFNFSIYSNQRDYNIEESNWIRNTDPYNLIEDGISYQYLYIPNNLNQTVDVKSVSPGVVENIGINTGGDFYKVGDSVVFDNTDTQGFGASAEVSLILGKSVDSVSVATSTIIGVEIYPGESTGQYRIYAENPHNFKNNDLISVGGLSTTSSQIDGSYNVGITTSVFVLSGVGTTASDLGSTNITGFVTYFGISGNLDFLNIRENDILRINSEKVKVLNVDRPSSRIRVLRAVNGTVGSSHSFTSILYADERKLTFNAGFNTTFTSNINREIYFDPKESLGIGSAFGVGIGTTIVFSNPGFGVTEVFVPTKSIYIKNHNLETGDELTYLTNGGSGIEVLVSSTSGISTLQNNQKLYVAKISSDLIGISTVKVAIGLTGSFVGVASTYSGSTTLFFSGIGTGEYHSFKTNYDVLTGNISRNIVTVSTSSTHGLSTNDNVYVDINPSISTTFNIKYNDYNRKLLVNPKNFVSGDVNITSNTFYVENHGFFTGQKVVHNTNSLYGLTNNQIYYVVKVSDNEFKLSSTYYDSLQLKPSIVGLSSAYEGTISAVNPQIRVYSNSSITFDLSDSSLSYTKNGTSYSAFDLNFYTDENFTRLWNKSNEEVSFNVQKFGRVGITSDARLTLNVNDNIPRTLFYKLDPVFESDLPAEKQEVNIDKDVISGNQIFVEKSKYNGKQKVYVNSPSTFTYTLKEKPERSSYSGSSSNIKYETDSRTANGSISKFLIKDGGKNYYSIPGITTITSNAGSGALIEASSTSIGKIKKTKIKDIGFRFPSDNTLKPSTNLTEIIKIDSLYSIDSIGISSFGRGYTSAPKLLVFDGKTNNLVSDLDLRYNLGDSNVTILKNTFGISNVKPKIIPIQNTNGVGINTVGFNTATKDVTIFLSNGFSTEESFPFKVNDKVLIENISVGVGSTGKGYNSSDYGYKLFTLTSVDENIGGIGSVTYNLSDELGNLSSPGTYDFINSSGRIIPEKYFPIFDVKLKENNYIIGETVVSNSSRGTVESWDPKVGILKISSSQNFHVNEVIEGLSSKSQGIASSIKSFDSYLEIAPFSRVEQGWQSNSGVLNDNMQRIQDSFYYQNFSYSLRSRVDYDTWDDVVSSLNHTSGFRKFSDYQLESSLDEQNSNSMVVGLSTDLSFFETVNELVGYVDLNCVYDFDLVKENYLNINSRTVSDEIIFSSRILTDFFESVGNRVLSIDDVSGQFNSNPRPTAFAVVDTFDLATHRSQKYITYVRDRRFNAQRQILIVDLVHDNNFGYINQYGRVESVYDQGSFDFSISGNQGQLLFYPNNFTVNNYDITCLSYKLSDSLLGIGTTSLGNVAEVRTNSTNISSGITTTIVGIASTYTSAKILLSINPDINYREYEFNEINVVHDGTNVSIVEYGQLSTTPGVFASSGFGTYNAYLDSSELKIDFTPNPSVGVGTTGVINTIEVVLSDSTVSGLTTSLDLKHYRIETTETTITSSASPTENVVASFPTQISAQDEGYDASYFIIQVSDTTNNTVQMSEVLVLDDYNSSLETEDVYLLEYGNVETVSGLGTVGARLIKPTVGVAATVELLFTPLPNIDTNVKVYMNALRQQDDDKSVIEFNNGSMESVFSTYYGTETDIKRAFELNHENTPIFDRSFDGSSSDEVSVSSNTIKIPNHFFVTGENVTYIHAGAGSTQAIGIASTSFVGIGNTSLLPSSVYIVKIDEDKIKLASSAENALKQVPQTLSITHVGIGTSHRFVSKNQNAKVVLAVDNIIQSPVVSTSVTTTLARRAFTTDDLIYFTGITSFFGGDLIRVNDEIMRIDGVGIGSTNAIRVRREWLGTTLVGHSTGDTVTKVNGNYNIVNNILNFTEAPYGNIPIGTSTNAPDDRDWVGLSTGSSFQGRVFLRSGILDSSDETYHKNYIFDDISSEFDGSERDFNLKSNGINVTGISSENAFILINDVFQGPGISYDYTLSEVAGITTISFTGTASSISSDVNTSNLPAGGIIVSVGSSEGFGYQPLVAAGGTAIVSLAGTIQSISIGNSGSGYRSGVQTVRVGVQTYSNDGTNIEFIGTATVSNGSIVSVAITNPGVGYTNTNPPIVLFDEPLSYSDIPLIYSSQSSGSGLNATIDIVVGQGSSVIDFEIKNTGYGYGNGEILTVPVGGATGIPTSSGFNEFNISVQKIFTDEFTGWSIGTLQVLDNIERYFDGERSSFPLRLGGNPISIIAPRGSKINVQDVLIIFVNDILQVPGFGYKFEGGSTINFTEPLKVGDKVKILFYKGSGDVDVIFRNVIETVKVGDELTIGYDASIGQQPYLQEDSRTVVNVNSTDVVETGPYFGPGNTQNEDLLRPVVWCRQTEDKIINERGIGKDRELYEPVINPFAYIIKSVGIGSTIVYVDNLKPFFNPVNENDTSLSFQNSVKFMSQDVKVSASATAIVSSAGTISSINIIDGGIGYITNPSVSIGSTLQSIGIGTTAEAISSISLGIVTSISVTNPGSGYTSSNPPVVLISPPETLHEQNSVREFKGDGGVIVGFGTTTISSQTQLIFDLFIPKDSFLRDSSLVGTAITISSLESNDYFVVYNSLVGFASTSLTSLNLNDEVIGIGTNFVDNVYEVNSSEIVYRNVTGVGVTYVKRVFVKVSNNFDNGVGIVTSNYLGSYSWGRITVTSRTGINSYTSYTQDGIGGISTSSYIMRTLPLRYKEYLV